MNRERKVRIWHKANKEFLNSEHIHFNLNGEVLSMTYNAYSGNYDCISEDVIVDDTTGLKDKNGKEVYEGDIVKRYEDMFNPFFAIFLVKYDTMFCRFGLNLFNSNVVSSIKVQVIGETFYGEHNNPENLEIIGNIHENKELLNES